MRRIVGLEGKDALSFLQGLVTADVGGALPVWSGLLTPQGKALFDFIVWAEGDDLLIDCEDAQADALARRLTLYRLRRLTLSGLPIARIPLRHLGGVTWLSYGQNR